MHNLSIELIKQFFSQYPRLDFLFQTEFAANRIRPAEKAVVFAETSAFIRLFPAFAYKEGTNPFSGNLPPSLITKALKQFDPFAWRVTLQATSLTAVDASAVQEKTAPAPAAPGITAQAAIGAAAAAELFGLPHFFVEELYSTYPLAFIETFLKRSCRERPLFLRKIGNRELLDAAIIPVAGVPGAYQYMDPILDFKADWYSKGFFTIQDLSGQLACLLINPKPGNKVLDACAGNGGKSVVLADLMEARGTLFALHQTKREYRELKQRLRCHQIQNVHQLQADALTDLPAALDIILVDVPCSGSGVIRRNPDLIYRLHALDFSGFTANQLSILSTFASRLKPGGKLVYTTCSVLAKENEQVITAFLNNAHGEYTYSDFTAGKKYYRLEQAAAATQTLGGSPDLNCDGFFIAGLTKSA